MKTILLRGAEVKQVMKHRLGSKVWGLMFLWACAAAAENRFTLQAADLSIRC
jgi:hypothetical protein